MSRSKLLLLIASFSGFGDRRSPPSAVLLHRGVVVASSMSSLVAVVLEVRRVVALLQKTVQQHLPVIDGFHVGICVFGFGGLRGQMGRSDWVVGFEKTGIAREADRHWSTPGRPLCAAYWSCRRCAAPPARCAPGVALSREIVQGHAGEG